MRLPQLLNDYHETNRIDPHRGPNIVAHFSRGADLQTCQQDATEGAAPTGARGVSAGDDPRANSFSFLPETSPWGTITAPGTQQMGNPVHQVHLDALDGCHHGHQR